MRHKETKVIKIKNQKFESLKREAKSKQKEGLGYIRTNEKFEVI